MANHPDYPGATSRIKNGKEVWRYRANRHAKQISLPGRPGELEFEAAYTAAVQGAARPLATIVALPGASMPKTFGAARRLLEASSEWHDLDADTQTNKMRYLNRFLAERVDPAFKLTFAELPVEKMDFHMLDALIARIKKRDGANVAKRWLEVVNNLIVQALRAKWISYHPGFGLTQSPIPSDGHLEWPRHIREQYEQHWPIGTAARTAYELGYWLGNRRSDVVRLSNDQRVRIDFETSDGDLLVVDAFEFRQKKNEKRTGGKQMFLPILPWLDQALPRHAGTVLVNTRGTPYSAKALTGMFQDWTRKAGLEPGFTLHGLRKSLGVRLGELGLSARQIMEVLGHSNLAAAEIYVRKAEKKRLTVDSFAALEAAEKRRRLRVVK